MPGRAGCGCCVRTGCDGNGRGPPSRLGVVGRGGGGYAGRGGAGDAGRVPLGAAARAAGSTAPPERVPAAGACADGTGALTMRGCDTGGRFAGSNGRAGCGVLPGSSIRRRSVGGTNRPCAAADGASACGSSIGAAGSSILAARAAGAGGAAATSGSSTGMTSGSGAAADGASWTTGASTRGGAGFTVLTSRGGPSTGADGFGGSTFFAAAAFLPPFTGAGVSANISPEGSAIFRCRATRSTNERATTSSIVLEALFSSIP